jgi:hypothetical protein
MVVSLLVPAVVVRTTQQNVRMMTTKWNQQWHRNDDGLRRCCILRCTSSRNLIIVDLISKLVLCAFSSVIVGPCSLIKGGISRRASSVCFGSRPAKDRCCVQTRRVRSKQQRGYCWIDPSIYIEKVSWEFPDFAAKNGF